MKVVEYGRVSTDKQTLEQQNRTVQEWLKRNGLKSDIVLYSQIYEIEGDYDKAATVILDYLKDNDSGTAVRMYDRLKHLKPHCSADISEQITPYEN